MRKLLIASSCLLVSVFFGISCSKEKGSSSITVDCSTVTNKAFAADVNPIIQGSCNTGGCHAAGSSNGPGPLTNYAQVSAAASSVRSAIASGRMPQNGTLSAAQRSSVICWIDSGTPNN